MGLTTLAWLGALAALAVPLAIHLWSRRRTTPVSVGSIRFLEGVPPVRHRTLRLRNPWRLALRLAMLACLVLALAGPYLTRGTPPRAERWLVVTPQASQSQAGTALVDSLTGLADQVRLLHPGFPPLGADITPASVDLWTLLFILDDSLPPGSRIDVVAEPGTGRVAGRRPTLASVVTWYPVSETGEPADGSPPAESRHPILAVYHDAERRDDGRYLASALRALWPAGDSVPVTRHGTESPGAVTATWIAWLSSSPPPAAVMQRVEEGATLLTDAGPSVEVASTIVFANDVPEDRPVRLTRRGELHEGAALWRDDRGAPLLTVTRHGAGLHYRLATRLHPAWTDLPMRGVFPRVVRSMVTGFPAPTPLPMAVHQIVPQHDPSVGDRRRSGRGSPMSLFLPLWLLAASLFLTDVVLGHRATAGSRPA